jgi:hypothetical protein
LLLQYRVRIFCSFPLYPSLAGWIIHPIYKP